MSNVLTENGEVKCGHQGKASVSGAPKLKVNGASVLLMEGVKSKSIDGCKTPDDTSKSTKPCKTVVSATGEATKLKVNGQGVLLDSLKGITDGTPTPTLLSAQAGQTKLQAT